MNILNRKEEKIRTTLYLTKENREKLDMIPKGQKTELMNYAIAKVLHELERQKIKEKILTLLSKPLSGKKESISTQDALQEIRKRELLKLLGVNSEVSY